MIRLPARALESFVAKAFQQVGLPEADARTVAGLMVEADLQGSEGHGIFRLPQYIRRIRAGGVNPKPRIRVERERAATALVHGDNGMGHLVMKFAAELGDAIPAAHLKVAAAIGSALETAAADPRYAPRRPMLLPRLLSAVGDGDTSRRDLARMISRDPALVGSLLRLANSPVYRRNAPPVESIERAITVMGTQGIRSLIAAALVQPVFRADGGQSGRFAEITWESTYRAAAAAEVRHREIAQHRVGTISPGRAVDDPGLPPGRLGQDQIGPALLQRGPHLGAHEDGERPRRNQESAAGGMPVAARRAGRRQGCTADRSRRACEQR